MTQDEQHPDQDAEWKFSGFLLPTTTPVPDQVFDELLYHLTPTEVVVLLYLIRRTFGFKKSSDNISLKQICEGITTKDGRILDQGTGLSKATVARVIKSLEAKQVIKRTRQHSLQKGDEPTTYELNFLTPVSQFETPRVSPMRQGGVSELNTQQTVKQQTVNVVVIDTLQKFKVERSKAEELAGKYSREHIEAKIEYLEWKLATKTRGRPVTDAAAWLIQAIERNYQPPTSFKTKTQREQEAAEIAARAAEIEQEQQEHVEQTGRERVARLEALERQYGTTEKDHEIWSEILQEIKVSTSGANYQSWFPGTTLLSLKDSQAIIGVPNRYSQEWLSGRLAPIIKRAFKAVVEKDVTLAFVVMRAGPDSSPPA